MIGPKSITDNGTTPGSKLSDTQGLAFDSGGNLWVSDYGHGRVVEYGSAATSSESSAVTSTSKGGGVPEFPFQLRDRDCVYDCHSWSDARGKTAFFYRCVVQ